MQPLTLSLPDTFAANRRPPPPLPLQPLPPSCHHRHRHHHGRTHHCPLPKKGATAAPPPAYQRQHNMEMFTSPDDLDLFNLSTVFEVCDVGRGNLAISKLLALKNFGPFLQYTYYWIVPIICQCIPGRHCPFFDLSPFFFLSVSCHFWYPFPYFLRESFICLKVSFSTKIQIKISFLTKIQIKLIR